MYAVIRDRSRQHRVRPGEVILIDLRADLAPQQEVVFDQVCLLGGEDPRVGAPLVEGVSVVGRVLGEEAGPKVVVGKFKRRKNYRRKTGFRARYTRVRIERIQA